MITLNGYKILSAQQGSAQAGNASSMSINLISVDGSATTTRFPQASGVGKSQFHEQMINRPYSTPGVHFGTGDTAVTLEDYYLSGTMLQNISVAVQTSYITPNDDGCVYGVKYLITNNNSEAVTIKEVMLTIGRYSTNSASSVTGPYVMVDRTVLDEPVTIPAGEIGMVTYEIRLNYPTA